jgi:hypothetical protein
VSGEVGNLQLPDVPLIGGTTVQFPGCVAFTEGAGTCAEQTLAVDVDVVYPVSILPVEVADAVPDSGNAGPL